MTEPQLYLLIISHIVLGIGCTSAGMIIGLLIGMAYVKYNIKLIWDDR